MRYYENIVYIAVYLVGEVQFMFKQGTFWKVHNGMSKMAYDGRTIISVRDLAKNCRVSANTIYKMWAMVINETEKMTVYRSGRYYQVDARIEDGVKCFVVSERIYNHVHA